MWTLDHFPLKIIWFCHVGIISFSSSSIILANQNRYERRKKEKKKMIGCTWFQNLHSLFDSLSFFFFFYGIKVFVGYWIFKAWIFPVPYLLLATSIKIWYLRFKTTLTWQLLSFSELVNRYRYLYRSIYTQFIRLDFRVWNKFVFVLGRIENT